MGAFWVSFSEKKGAVPGEKYRKAVAKVQKKAKKKQWSVGHRAGAMYFS